jgi:hypothetical protein
MHELAAMLAAEADKDRAIALRRAEDLPEWERDLMKGWITEQFRPPFTISGDDGTITVHTRTPDTLKDSSKLPRQIQEVFLSYEPPRDQTERLGLAFKSVTIRLAEVRDEYDLFKVVRIVSEDAIWAHGLGEKLRRALLLCQTRVSHFRPLPVGIFLVFILALVIDVGVYMGGAAVLGATVKDYSSLMTADLRKSLFPLVAIFSILCALVLVRYVFSLYPLVEIEGFAQSSREKSKKRLKWIGAAVLLPYLINLLGQLRWFE